MKTDEWNTFRSFDYPLCTAIFQLKYHQDLFSVYTMQHSLTLNNIDFLFYFIFYFMHDHHSGVFCEDQEKLFEHVMGCLTNYPIV